MASAGLGTFSATGLLLGSKTDKSTLGRRAPVMVGKRDVGRRRLDPGDGRD